MPNLVKIEQLDSNKYNEIELRHFNDYAERKTIKQLVELWDRSITFKFDDERHVTNFNLINPSTGFYNVTVYPKIYRGTPKTLVFENASGTVMFSFVFDCDIRPAWAK
jgi:hypothetical protein